MKKVLLIEDNEDFRLNTTEILELNDYDVITAANGVEGIEKAVLTKPDIIICDVMMPQMDGYGVINILTKNPETSSIPFIFLTAKAEKSDIRKGMNLGADDYLLKPFDEQSLINSIETRIARNQKIKAQILQAFVGKSVDIDEADKHQDIRSLLEQKKSKTFKSKEELYREGDFPHYIYHVNAGKIKCQKTDSYGKTFVTQIINEGEFFGYMPILEGAEHHESALALDDTEVTIIPKEDFTKLISNNREVANHFFKLLSGNIKEKEEKLLQLAYAPVKERIARALLNLSKDTKTINISRDDLANIVGTAKESLVRNLSSFKSEGIISSSGREIVVHKPEELHRLLDLV